MRIYYIEIPITVKHLALFFVYVNLKIKRYIYAYLLCTVLTSNRHHILKTFSIKSKRLQIKKQTAKHNSNCLIKFNSLLNGFQIVLTSLHNNDEQTIN